MSIEQVIRSSYKLEIEGLQLRILNLENACREALELQDEGFHLAASLVLAKALGAPEKKHE